MPTFKAPSMDEVTTKTDLINWVRAWRAMLRDIDRQLATDAGMLRAMLKAQDQKQGTRAAASCVRPLVWAATILYSVRRAFTLAGTRIYNNYAPENRPRPKRTEIDWDR